RPEVYARQRVQLTGTNRPRAWILLTFVRSEVLVLAMEFSGAGRASAPPLTQISVAIAVGSHPFPFRTRKLSPPAPMVLGERSPGRVGRRRISHSNGPLRGSVRRF